MEKRDAKIKCTGCGTHYKLKIPVTDQPVSFKCKKCNKVLKLKLKSTPAPEIAPQESPDSLDFKFETTQLPDAADFQDTVPRAPEIEDHTFGQSLVESKANTEANRHWIVLAGDSVQGPLTDNEIISMIERDEIAAETPLRMGERPWIKASEIPLFRDYFPPKEELHEDKKEKVVPGVIGTNIAGILPIPFVRENLVPFLILTAVSVVLAILLSFDLFIGLGASIIGWILLYGYLGNVFQNAKTLEKFSAPSWNLNNLKVWAVSGAKFLLTLFIFCLLPTTILLAILIAGFLNNLDIMGYVAMILVIVLFLAYMYILPSVLIVSETSSLNASLKPGNWLNIVKRYSADYKSMGIISVGLGAVILFTILSTLFLTDIQDFGFILSGLILGITLAYSNFLLFYLAGLFTQKTQNKGLSTAVA